MNREQMIAWLMLEGWEYHAENDEWYPIMHRDKQGYPLHIRHGGFFWGRHNALHTTSSWEAATDEHLSMALANLGVVL